MHLQSTFAPPPIHMQPCLLSSINHFSNVPKFLQLNHYGQNLVSDHNHSELLTFLLFLTSGKQLLAYISMSLQMQILEPQHFMIYACIFKLLQVHDLKFKAALWCDLLGFAFVSGGLCEVSLYKINRNESQEF